MIREDNWERGGSWKLPAEMLERVFHLLPPKDRKVVVQVCRWWREVGEAPCLWKWVVLRVAQENQGSMAELLRSRRVSRLGRLVVRDGVGLSEELLQAVAAHPALERLLVGAYVTPPPRPSLVAEVLGGVEELRLSIQLRRDYSAWLEAVASLPQEGSRLRKLSLSENTLSSKVEPELLGRTVARVEEVNLWRTSLSPQQGAALCSALQEPASRVRVLNLSETNLATVRAEELGAAVARLEEVNLDYTRLTSTQARQLWAALAGPSRLRKLTIQNNCLSSVEPEVLAEAANRLEVLDLHEGSLTWHQVTALLRRALLGTSLRHLKFSYTFQPPTEQYRAYVTLVRRAKKAIPAIYPHRLRPPPA